MADFFERVALVLNWRTRSLWMAIFFMIVSTAFGYIADNSLENILLTGTQQSQMLHNLLKPIFGSVYLLFFALSIIIPLMVFVKDWKAFHNRRW